MGVGCVRVLGAENNKRFPQFSVIVLFHVQNCQEILRSHFHYLSFALLERFSEQFIHLNNMNFQKKLTKTFLGSLIAMCDVRREKVTF